MPSKTERELPPQFLVETAGKTGTAQIFDRVSGSYYKNKYLASFVGFVPADAPKIGFW